MTSPSFGQGLLEHPKKPKQKSVWPKRGEQILSHDNSVYNAQLAAEASYRRDWLTRRFRGRTWAARFPRRGACFSEQTARNPIA